MIRENEELIVLSNDTHRCFDGEIIKVRVKDRAIYRHNCLFTTNYDMIYNRTKETKTVPYKDEFREATVFEYDRIKQIYHSK